MGGSAPHFCRVRPRSSASPPCRGGFEVGRSYDAGNNLTGSNNSATATSSTRTFDPAHQLATLVKTVNGTTANNLTYSYNANGDRTGATDSITSASTTYGYNQNDQLTGYTSGATSATYSYDGTGLRTSKTVGGVAEGYVWNLAEGLPSNIQDGTTKYVTGPGGLPLEQVASGGTVLYYYQDQLGSTRELMDASGTTAATYTYDAYGNLKSSTGAVSNPFQYAGQYTDGESGLQYLRARYYDPSTQQFLTVDPLAAMTGEPYSYTAGNPVNGADPYGLDCSLFGGSLPFGSGGTCNGQLGNAIGYGLGQVGNALGYLGNRWGQSWAGEDPCAYAAGAGTVRFDTEKHAKGAIKRGWTNQDIEDVINNPKLTRDNMNRATGNTATYYYRSDGNYVARDDVTGEIFHVSDTHDPGWIDPNTGRPIEPISTEPEVPEVPLEPLP